MTDDATTAHAGDDAPWERFQRDVAFMWQQAMGCWSTLMLVHGRMDHEQLAMVTLQMYHYVKDTVAVLHHALAALPDAPEHDDYRALLHYFAADEAGHELVALRDLEALGYDAEVCKATLPLPTTHNLQAANRAGVDAWGPYYLLGETWATERVGAVISARIHEAYRADGGLAHGVSFYEVHGEADQGHADRSTALLRATLARDPALYRPTLMGCLTAWRNLILLGMEIQSYRLYPADFLPTPRGARAW